MSNDLSITKNKMSFHESLKRLSGCSNFDSHFPLLYTTYPANSSIVHVSGPVVIVKDALKNSSWELCFVKQDHK